MLICTWVIDQIISLDLQCVLGVTCTSCACLSPHSIFSKPQVCHRIGSTTEGNEPFLAMSSLFTQYTTASPYMWLQSSSHHMLWVVAIHVIPLGKIPSQSTLASAHLVCYATHALLMRTWDSNRHHRRRGKGVRGMIPFLGRPLMCSYCGYCYTTYSLLSLPMIGTITWQPKYLASLLLLDGKYDAIYTVCTRIVVLQLFWAL